MARNKAPEPDGKAAPASLPDKLRLVEEHIRQHYDVRYNVVKEVVEWRPAATGEPFRVLDDYHLNSLSRELTHCQRPMSPDGLYRLLSSDFTTRVNPVQEYFHTLPQPAARGHIAALCGTLTVEDPQQVQRYVTKWLVATVANALTDGGCQNHTCLVLTGGQGQYKTTWLDNLCPPALRAHYLFTGKIATESKDTLALLAEYLLLNIDDQLRVLNRRDEEALKTLITQPSVTVRKPYGRLYSHLPRLASFMASVNSPDFLTDPTGSRRFLPIAVTRIDIAAAKQLNLDAVWAEAHALFREGFEYWFTSEETEALNHANEAFQHYPVEHDLVVQFLRPGSEKLTLAQIKALLQRASGLHNLRDNHLSAALKRLGVVKEQKHLVAGQNAVRYYLVQPQGLPVGVCP
jgi:predicted P-loop ATPase